MTARLTIPLGERRGCLVPSSVLTLADDGTVVVNLVGADNRIVFDPVEIIDDSPGGLWIGVRRAACEGLLDARDHLAVGPCLFDAQRVLAGTEIVRRAQRPEALLVGLGGPDLFVVKIYLQAGARLGAAGQDDASGIVVIDGAEHGRVATQHIFRHDESQQRPVGAHLRLRRGRAIGAKRLLRHDEARKVARRHVRRLQHLAGPFAGAPARRRRASRGTRLAGNALAARRHHDHHDAADRRGPPSPQSALNDNSWRPAASGSPGTRTHSPRLS
ncbi:MAG: hypothetical protein EXQ97_05485 [Alphaproteobacteria bacterium]|nr:hypothetical protein [Alphaproteobacteria bacterium]